MKIAFFSLSYNRLGCLKKNIEAVKKQTYRDFDIFVVNNGSSDGTAEWLEEQSDVTVINIQDNSGAANGFHVGIHELYERGYDWIWVMDDDGVPDCNQLKLLLEKAIKFNLGIAHALVCDIDDPTKLVFRINGKFDVSCFKNMETIDGFIHPINGMLIKRAVVTEIGNFIPEFYLWGVEGEYMARAKINGVKLATVVDAIQLHPAPSRNKKRKYYNVIPGVRKYYIPCYDNLDAWYAVRNRGYIHTHYTPVKKRIMYILAHVACYSMRLKFKTLFRFLKYYNEGCDNIIGKEGVRISDPAKSLKTKSFKTK